MDEITAIRMKTSVAASHVLSIGARKISSSLDTFSSWLLAGFGAVFGLLLANLPDLSKHVSVRSIKVGATLFIVSALLAAAQKLLASYVAASTGGSEEGRKIGVELAHSPIPLDVEAMYAMVNRGLYWPVNRFNARMTALASSGDYAAVGRHHAHIAQLQILFVVVQCGLSLTAGGVVVYGIAI